ncbi:MAG: hypothetical protein K6F68_03770 [Clostridiales bacterium]|nr:hypothetical protein [Clostridiales bacterium]
MSENTRESALLKRIYRTSFRGGRRLPAFVFDSVFLCAASFFGVYLAVRPHFRNRTAAAAISVIVLSLAVLVFIAVRRFLFERHVEKMRREAEDELFGLKLIMEPELDSLLSPHDPSVYISRSIDALTADEVKNAYLACEKPVTVIAFAEPTEAAKKLLGSLSDIAVKTPVEYFGRERLGFVKAGESEIDAQIIKKHGGICKRPALRKELFKISKERASKYLLLGFALMLMSFFMRFAVYYRTAASVILGVGTAVFALDAYKKAARTSG